MCRRSIVGRFSRLGLVVLAACGGSDPTTEPDAAVTPDAYVDLSGPVFEPDHIVDVSITVAQTDWDKLRNETRTINSVIEGDCLAQPAPSPFSTYEAAVTVDGTAFPRVGLKKKGFLGSLDNVKPSLKVIFDEYVPDAEYLGLTKLTLNNSRQDPALVRQCITYATFGAAGITVPRCNFAHVKVNGTDLGVYVNVETIDHRLTKKRYADGTGNLYEGTLSDLRPGWTGTFDVKGSADGADLTAVADVLGNSSDGTLLADLAPLIDVDRFITYWAMEIITSHWDGYANNRNNFFLYHDPTTGKLEFIPWGVDGTLLPDATFGPLGNTTGPVAVTANGLLANRLLGLAQTRQQLFDRERALLTSAFSESAMLAEIDRMEALIAPIADPAQGTGWHAEVEHVREFVRGRRAKLTAALDAGPTWTDPLPGSPCLTIEATVSATFSTTWDTINSDPFSTGASTMSLTTNGTTTQLVPIGSRAGLDPNPPAGQPPAAVVQIFARRPSDNHVIFVHLAIPQQLMFPRTGTVGFFDSQGLVFDFDPGTNTSTIIGFMLGTFQLTQASMTANAPIAGSFTDVHADLQAAMKRSSTVRPGFRVVGIPQLALPVPH